MFSIKAYVNKLMEIDGIQLDDFEGCTEKDIQDLMESQNISRLPKIYVEFLRHLGKKTGKNFLIGEDILCPHLEGIREGFDWLLEKYKIDWEIPENIFVFWTHQDYQFYYFHVDEGDDPTVYIITYAMKSPEKVFDHLSQLFEDLLKRHEDFIKKRREKD
jgi:hypothetical protein